MGSAVTISGVARRTRTMEKRPCGRAACRTYNPSLFKAPSLSHYAMQAASGPDKLSDAAAERRRGYDHPQRQHHHHHRSKNPAFRPIRNSSGRSAGSREGDQAPVRQQHSVAAGGGGGRADNAGHVSRSNASLDGTQMHGLSRPTSWHDRGGR